MSNQLRVQTPLPSRYPAYRIVSEAGELLAAVPISASGDSGKLAHVMAAAPELLAAITRLVNCIVPDGSHEETDAITQALDAIAKAEGQPTLPQAAR